MESKRQPGLDLVRACALVLVLVTHAVTYSRVLEYHLLSWKWAVYLYIRFAALACVPLFMLLTGYLNSRKTLSRQYYKGLIPVLTSYVTISLCTAWAMNRLSLKAYTPFSAVLSVLDFTANGYAWYVQMYIGLFLLIPFLNLLYGRLETKQAKRLLIGTLAFLTLLPATLSSFSVLGRPLKVVPDFWQALYPAAYYFIGAYLQEYRPRLPKAKAFLWVLAAAAVPSGLCYLFSVRDGAYAWYMMNGFQTLPTAALAVVLFLFLYDCRVSFGPLRVLSNQLARYSLDIYLFSYPVDRYLYSRLTLDLPWMFLLTLGISYLLARLLHVLLDPPLRRIMRTDPN